MEQTAERGAEVGGVEPCGIARVELEIPIAAPPERVWRGMVEEIGAWWRPDFHVTAGGRMTLEPRAGGRMYESGPGGAYAPAA